MLEQRMSGFWIARLLAFVACGVLAGVMVLAGVELAVQILWPEWYAVPAAVLQMTGQQGSVEPVEPVEAEGALAPEPTPLPDIFVEDQTPTPTPIAELSAANQATPVAMPVPEAEPTAEPVSPTPADAPGAGETPGPLLPSRRFNVLLLGSDNDLKFAPGAVLTQSMILVSIDPGTADVAMISIPRDFWVPIARYGYQKIDVAYEVGGIALARSTVEGLFGVKIDYYAWVGLNGLVQVIDTVGGIDVMVQHPILDEMYPDDLNATDPYAFFRLYLPAGPQHLDGRTALEYVRSRHGDLESDFGRSARQQQVLLAIKDHVETLSILRQVPQLVTDLRGSLKTDLSLPALIQLAALARTIPPDRIHQQVLSAPDFATLGYSPDGTQQVVFPDWAAIRPAVKRLMRGSSEEASAGQ
jgi:LCP family protein required for cell wall assembly